MGKLMAMRDVVNDMKQVEGSRGTATVCRVAPGDGQMGPEQVSGLATQCYEIGHNKNNTGVSGLLPRPV